MTATVPRDLEGQFQRIAEQQRRRSGSANDEAGTDEQGEPRGPGNSNRRESQATKLVGLGTQGSDVVRVPGVQWFTNIDHGRRHEPGVPITFLTKHNPDQFRIVGSFNAGSHGEELGAVKTEIETNGVVAMWNGPVVDRTPLYKRIVIQRNGGS